MSTELGRSNRAVESRLAIPRRLIYLRDLPLLGSGKVNYPKLREIAEEGVS